MSKLAPLSVDQASESMQKTFESLRARIGVVPSMYRTLGHSPEVLDAVIGMGKAIRVGLDAKLRELAYLKIAQVHDCYY